MMEQIPKGSVDARLQWKHWNEAGSMSTKWGFSIMPRGGTEKYTATAQFSPAMVEDRGVEAFAMEAENLVINVVREFIAEEIFANDGVDVFGEDEVIFPHRD